MKIFLKITIYLIPVVLVGYLLWQNIRPVLSLHYTVDGKSAMFPALTPWNHVSDLSSDQYGQYREIKEYPINFDIRLPRKFDRVKFDIKYSYPKDKYFSFGFAANVDKTDYQTVIIQNNNYLPVADWSGEFDISNTPTPFYKLRFQFFNGVNEKSDFLKIREINATFSGQDFGWQDIVGKFFNKF